MSKPKPIDVECKVQFQAVFGWVPKNGATNDIKVTTFPPVSTRESAEIIVGNIRQWAQQQLDHTGSEDFTGYFCYVVEICNGDLPAPYYDDTPTSPLSSSGRNHGRKRNRLDSLG